MSIAWAQIIDGSGYDYAYGIAVDPFGNVYVTGTSSTSGFQIETASGTVTKPSNTSQNDQGTFIIKYNASGVCQWANFIDGYSDEYESGVATDRSGNVYIAVNTTTSGFQIATASGTVTKPLNMSLMGFGLVVLKYNSSGVCQWASFLDGVYQEAMEGNLVNNIAVDISGNVYITGYTDTTGFQITTASGTVTKPSNASQGAFVVKYNTSGVCQWASFLDGASADQGRDITVDVSGNIYISGSTSTSGFQITTASGTVTKPFAERSYGAFVVKYNSSGVCQWASFVDGASEEQGFSVAVDVLGNVYMTGHTDTSGLQIATASGTVVNPLSEDELDTGIFIVKYNASGVCQWAQFINSESDESAYDITTDISGNVYIIGYTDTSGFQIATASGTVTKPSNTQMYDNGAFLVKYNSSGVCQWAYFLDGDESEKGHGIAVDTSGNVYITGYTSTSGLQITTASGTVTKPFQSTTGGFVIKYVFETQTPPTSDSLPSFVFPPGDQTEQRTTDRRGDRAISSGYRRGPVDFQTLLRIRKGRTSGCC